MRTYLILGIVMAFFLVGCASTTDVKMPLVDENEQQHDPMHDMHAGMPCHQMPDGSWMGDCDDQGHDGHVHQVRSELEFLVEMIPHHQEAIDSSQELLALGVEDEALVSLLQAIIQEQEQEIALMQSWLDQWYAQEQYAPTYQPMMRSLSGLTIDEAVTVFLQDMIHHHEMAVVMAQSVLELDHREEVAQLAQAIIALQREEIALMQSFLEE